MKVVRIASACVFALAFAAAMPAVAQKKDHAHGNEKHFKVTPPADVKAAWAMITTKVSEAEKNLAAKQLDPLHQLGEEMEAAAQVLVEKSTMVAGDKKSRLSSALKQLDQNIDNFHHAAEDKNAAKLGLELGKIKGLLPLIQAQYPDGALK